MRRVYWVLSGLLVLSGCASPRPCVCSQDEKHVMRHMGMQADLERCHKAGK